MSKKRITTISIHCFKSFPVRLFHSRLKNQDVEPYSIFFKDSRANNHLPVTDKEMAMLKEAIIKSKADLFGLSVYAPYVSIAKRIIKLIREVSDAPIMIGGVYATITPEKALAIADYACRGEGEAVMDAIVERLKKGEDFKGIPGLWYKDENGKIVDTGMQRVTEDMNKMKFQAVGEENMYFIENDRYLKTDPELLDKDVWMMAGRGCMYQCAFCVNALYIPMQKGNGKFIRQRTPENVVQEIEERVKGHITPVERVFFADELFGIFGPWIKEFCDLYKERVNLPFFMELHPNLIKEDNIRMLSEAGLSSLDFGIQSGSEKIRNGVMNRPGTNKGIIEASWLLKKYNVTPVYDLILDNPFDTIEVLEESIGLILQLPKPLQFNVFKMQYFQNYPYTKAALEAGYITEEDITDEKIAKDTMTSWTFVPKLFTTARRDHLQSCIYMITRNIPMGDELSKKVLKSNNVLLGLYVNLIARLSYQWLIRTPAWAHRCVNGLRVLFSGDFKLFTQKFKAQLQKRSSQQETQVKQNDHAIIDREANSKLEENEAELANK